MVEVTIYIEGTDASGMNDAAQTADNSAFFREAFHRLFSQRLSPSDFRLSIEPFGSVTKARSQLDMIIRRGTSGVLLIDLDAPKAARQQRIDDNYAPLDTSALFFMIEEMEAWILSQPEMLDQYARQEGLVRKRTDDIAKNTLIKGLHPEEIPNPAGRLDTLLRQYFASNTSRRGKSKEKPKRYSKTKDGPKMIALLQLAPLMATFDDARALVAYLESLRKAKH